MFAGGDVVYEYDGTLDGFFCCVFESSPQAAFYGEKESLPLYQSIDRVCSEFVMCYPPGIPLLAPGERITEEVAAHIRYAKEKGCTITGPEDLEIRYLNVLKGV